MKTGWRYFLEVLQKDPKLRKEWLEILDERIQQGPDKLWKAIQGVEDALIKEWPDKSDFGPVSP